MCDLFNDILRKIVIILNDKVEILFLKNFSVVWLNKLKKFAYTLHIWFYFLDEKIKKVSKYFFKA